MAKNKRPAIKEIENKLGKMGFKKVEEKSETAKVSKEIKYPKVCSDILAVKENIKYENRGKSKK